MRKSVSWVVGKEEVVCLLGGNAAGKTTTMRCIMSLTPLWHGQILLDGHALHPMKTAEVVARGAAIVPEGRRIFPRMTVLENLELGAYLQDSRQLMGDIERVCKRFPRLAELRF